MSDNKLSPYRLEQAMSAAMRIIAELPEDEQLRRDTVEGETEAFEMMDRYAEVVIADEMLAERARERARRLEERAERRRGVITNMLEALDLREPVERPQYTASLSYRQKTVVTDADRLPPEFTRLSVDMVKLGKALRAGDVAGATLSNAAASLVLRTR